MVDMNKRDVLTPKQKFFPFNSFLFKVLVSFGNLTLRRHQVTTEVTQGNSYLQTLPRLPTLGLFGQPFYKLVGVMIRLASCDHKTLHFHISD